MEFRGQSWLEHSWLWLQSGLFAVWLLAFAFSLVALWRPRSPRFHRAVRGMWLGAMALFGAHWAGGATLAMMQRAAPISTRGLVLALAAFSLLMAGILSLARECFDAAPRRSERHLRAGRLVLTLFALSIAGIFFGGFALPDNFLFATPTTRALLHPLPLGWVLALGGAQLLTLERNLEVEGGSIEGGDIASPREATVWLLLFLIGLAAWNFDGHRVVLLVAYIGFAAFSIRAWSARHTISTRGQTTLCIGATLLGVALAWAMRDEWAAWPSQILAAWRVWPHVGAWSILVALLALLGGTRAADSLQLATSESAAVKALCLGTLAGALAASFLIGPSGALWWSFWPLAGLFFDLLASDDAHEHAWRRRLAFKHHPDAAAKPDGDGVALAASYSAERAAGESVGVSAAGGRAQDG